MKILTHRALILYYFWITIEHLQNLQGELLWHFPPSSYSWVSLLLIYLAFFFDFFFFFWPASDSRLKMARISMLHYQYHLAQFKLDSIYIIKQTGSVWTDGKVFPKKFWEYKTHEWSTLLQKIQVYNDPKQAAIATDWSNFKVWKATFCSCNSITWQNE